ncbi:MAG TPA: ATP-binding protein [Bryobacteraceae bacterium]|nr:ATP-binding protein [Bryobacteraceae bacterium]
MSRTPQRTLLSWSSGKDSAWSFQLLQQNPDIEITALLTTFNAAANRVAMHAVRRELVEAQALRLGLPLWSIDLPWPCPNQVYEGLMAGMLDRAREQGITAVAFGDLFLEDIRQYRERQMEGTGLSPLFPVWQIPTAELAEELLDSGVKAKVTCVDLAKLEASYSGREYDREFLRSLPSEIDPCGENGEFHTFVYEAPFFPRPIKVTLGEIVVRDGFAFADLAPA